MVSEQKISKEQVATFADTVEITELAVGNSRFGIGSMLPRSRVVGIFGCICLVNGVVQTQNIQELARGIFTAFTGI